MPYMLVVLLAIAACQPTPPAPATSAAPQVAVLPGATPASTTDPCPPTSAKSHVKIGERIVPVDLAWTPQDRARGLSGRRCLARGTGLVIGWDEPTPARIWMPDMNFAIDVVFVREGKVVAVYADAQPCVAGKPCPSFGPDVPVDYVLEVPAGSAREWGVKAGDHVTLTR